MTQSDKLNYKSPREISKLFVKIPDLTTKTIITPSEVRTNPPHPPTAKTTTPSKGRGKKTASKGVNTKEKDLEGLN